MAASPDPLAPSPCKEQIGIAREIGRHKFVMSLYYLKSFPAATLGACMLTTKAHNQHW